MEEEERKAILTEMQNEEFIKGISFAINSIRDKLTELENELIRLQQKK